MRYSIQTLYSLRPLKGPEFFFFFFCDEIGWVLENKYLSYLAYVTNI
jgi:hypothetical protein